MGQAQHPIPLAGRKILTHTIHGEIYIRENGPHGVLIDQFLAPFPIPLTHELHCLIQPLLLRREEHQLHVDHRLQVEAPRLEALFGVAVVGGGFFAELAQVCEFDFSSPTLATTSLSTCGPHPLHHSDARTTPTTARASTFRVPRRGVAWPSTLRA